MFTTLINKAAHALKTIKNISWKEAVKEAYNLSKAKAIKVIRFKKKNGEETTRFAATKITPFYTPTGARKQYPHLTTFIDLGAAIKGERFVKSYITANLLSPA